jgi:DNA excision repair protein ERCC-3
MELHRQVAQLSHRMWASGLPEGAAGEEGYDDADGESGSLASGRDFASAWAGCKLVPKKDASARPLWVTGDGMIIVEYFSPNFTQLLRDFLVSIAEPVSRPSNMHVYQLKKETLYAAASSGIETDAIIENLEVASKAPLPKTVKDFIEVCTKSCGKVNLVLTDGRFMVETGAPDVLSALLGDRTINAARADRSASVEEASAPTARRVVDPPTFLQAQLHRDVDERRQRVLELASMPSSAASADLVSEIGREFEVALAEAEQAAQWARWVLGSAAGTARGGGGGGGGGVAGVTTVEDEGYGADAAASAAGTAVVQRFEIRRECVQEVKQAALALGYPMLEEYDYQSDPRFLTVGGRDTGAGAAGAAAAGTLRYAPLTTTTLRHYQQDCLQKVFGNKGRARSGQIVLPCGAGKTLVGIAATWTINKPTLVLCTSNVAVMQWKAQFELWTNARVTHDDSGKPNGLLRIFTGDRKDNIDEATIILTTYHMFAMDDNVRSAAGQKVMRKLKEIEFGLILLDEVHVTPAAKFKKVITHTKSHCKIGLTATLVREDDKISDLNILLGPKLCVLCCPLLRRPLDAVAHLPFPFLPFPSFLPSSLPPSLPLLFAGTKQTGSS